MNRVEIKGSTHVGEEKRRGLLKTEQILQRMEGAENGTFILTNLRVLYTSNATRGNAFASARLEHLTGVSLERKNITRNLIWAIAGFLVAFSVWRLAPNSFVGTFGGAVIGFAALLLLADYILHSNVSVLLFITAGGSVGGKLKSKAQGKAEDFVESLEYARTARLIASRPSPTERLPAEDWPPPNL